MTTPIKYLSDLSRNLYESNNIELYRKYFDSIYKSSGELYKYTLNLKEYSDLYRENNYRENEPYRIIDLIESKKVLFQEIARQNHTEITTDCSLDLYTDVHRSTIAVILHNIVDNAVKNTQNGNVLIRAFREDDYLEIRVIDSGKGITSEQIEYYTTFFESMNPAEFPIRKYGLGLNVVLYLIKKLRGSIVFKQNTPQGTIIEIKI